MPASARTVSLTEHQQRFRDTQVVAGRHGSSSEVVREALRRYVATKTTCAARRRILLTSSALRNKERLRSHEVSTTKSSWRTLISTWAPSAAKCDHPRLSDCPLRLERVG
jgi:putative addiction module CopG family antidote